MAEFNGMKMTHAGITLQAKALAGVPLTFTRVGIGDGYVPEGTDLQDLTELVHETEALNIVELVNIEDGKVRLQARVTNEGVTEGFYIREIGIFANDPDAGEILYAVTNAGERADYIPEEGGGIIEEILNLITIVGNAANVTATIDSASAATVQQVQELDARVSQVEADLTNDAAPIPYNLQRGQKIVDAVQESGLRLISMKGRTDINHVPLFDSGLWLTSTGTFNDVSPVRTEVEVQDGSPNVRNIVVAVKENESYTLSLNHNGYVAIYTNDASPTVIVSYRTDQVLTFNTGSNSNIRVFISSQGNNGSFYWETIMLTEGSKARPFVANMKPLGTVMIENKGKNLLKPHPDNIELSGSVTQNGNYDITLTATALGQGMSFLVPAIPDQQYYFRIAEHGARTYIVSIDSDGTETFLQTTTATTQYSVVTPSNSVTLKVGLTSGTVGAGTYNFKHYILSLEDIPFEPQDQSGLVILEVGRSNVDGTICDEVYERDGKLFRLQKFGYRVLDGSLDLNFFDDFDPSFKTITISNINGIVTSSGKLVVSKYNGLIIRSVISTSSVQEADMVSIGVANILISIANTDSGWGESYTPTADEVKAYFNGWYMWEYGTSYESYNGTGDKRWIKKKVGGGYVDGSSVPTVPTEMNDQGYIPYQLQYQLAQPVEVEISDVGGLELYAGLNQVELSEGVILGEPVTPQSSGDGTTYHINSGISGYETTHLAYRADKILVVYRNGEADGKWIITSAGTSYGNQRAYISASDYDPTATYSVDYIILDKYLLTTNAAEADLEGQANLATAVGKNVRDIADIKRDVTVIERDYARKQQPDWIKATLLNGWTGSVKYYKDELGNVMIVGDTVSGVGATNATIFRLPRGYRPLLYTPCVGADASEVAEKVFQIRDNGAYVDFAVLSPITAGHVVRFFAMFRAER